MSHIIRRLILLAPGAGAPSSHPWMQNWKQRLSDIGVAETFDYDYMRAGQKRPDPLPQLIAAHRKALLAAREKHQPDSTILIGKSMGGRIGCHLSLGEKADGLICLGYPLCAMGDRTKLRDEVLRALTTPILFVQGTRDALCPPDLLERVRAEMNNGRNAGRYRSTDLALNHRIHFRTDRETESLTPWNMRSFVGNQAVARSNTP